jgi:hypothetical protein
MNIEADSLVTIGLQKPPVTDFLQETDRAILFLDDKKVALHFVKHIWDKYSSIQLYEYYQEACRWSKMLP